MRLTGERQNQRQRRSRKNPAEMEAPHRCLLIRPEGAL
jgi:hypothetical protein